MRFGIIGFSGLVNLVAAGPLVARQYTNQTTTMQTMTFSSSVSAAASTSAAPECIQGEAICSANIIQRCVDGKYVAGNCVDNLSGYLNGGVGALCITSSPQAKDGVCALAPYNYDDPLNTKGTSSVSTMVWSSTSPFSSSSTHSAYLNASSTNVGSATVEPVSTITPPPQRPTITVYQPEVCVTVINQVTVIAYIYDVDITTVINGSPYTITPVSKTTVTETQGSQTVIVVKPATQTPIPTVTSTLYLGSGDASTVVYVPAAGPTSTKGAPVVSSLNAPAPTYVYTATDSVCVCPLPTTVTQYVTVETSVQATATPATKGAFSPATCTAPNVAAYPTIFPGLIIPVQPKNPAVSYGTQYSAVINADQEVVFQFDVKKSGTCALTFGLPPKDQLTTSSWSVSGDAQFSIAKSSMSVDQGLSYAELPTDLVFNDFTAIQSATSAIGSTFECVAGTTATFVVKSKNGAATSFFEDYNCPAVGIFLVEF